MPNVESEVQVDIRLMRREAVKMSVLQDSVLTPSDEKGKYSELLSDKLLSGKNSLEGTFNQSKSNFKVTSGCSF